MLAHNEFTVAGAAVVANTFENVKPAGKVKAPPKMSTVAIFVVAAVVSGGKITRGFVVAIGIICFQEVVCINDYPTRTRTFCEKRRTEL